MTEVKGKNLNNPGIKQISRDNKKGKTKKWQKPTLEDVSEKVMAQPYIRFT